MPPFLLVFLYLSWLSFRELFLILLVSLPFSIEYQFNPTLGTDLPDEFIMIWLTALSGLYVIYRPAILQRLFRHPLFIILLMGLSWSVVSACFSAQGLLSLKYLLAKSWYIGAFIFAALIVWKDDAAIKKSIWCLALALVTVMLIILARHATHRFSFAGINASVAPFFRNHVNYSAMLACIVPILLLYRQSLVGKMRRLLSILLLVILVAIFFTYARGAWLALLVGLLAGLLLRKKMLVNAFVITVLVSTGFICWLIQKDRYLGYAHDYRSTIFHQTFAEHLLATYRFKDVSTAERFNRWIAGVRMIPEHPITGTGPTTFYPLYKSYTVPAFRTWVSENREHSTVHNYFLLLTIEQGLPGLFFFLVLCCCLLYYAQRIYHRSENLFHRRVAMGVGMIFCMILSVNFLSDLVETDKIGSLFYLCIAILLALDKDKLKRIDPDFRRGHAH